MANIIQNKMNNTRLSNFELLRIFAMLFIVAHHFAYPGDFTFTTGIVTIPQLWVQFLAIGGKIGVNLFVMISGYFLIKSKRFKIEKLLKLWVQLVFYGIILFLVLTYTGIAPFKLNLLIKGIIPVSSGLWWFASTYFVLYLLHPFLNKLLLGLDKKTYLKLLILLFVIWSVIYTISLKNFEGNHLLWFIFLYALAGYIRLYYEDKVVSSKKYFIYALIGILIVISLMVSFDILGFKFSLVRKFLMNEKSIFSILIALFIFLGFKNIDLRYNKLINIISSTTFGIYLIHDYPLVRNFIWIKLFKNAMYADSLFIIPYSIGVILLVFAVCSIIELIRIKLIERNYINILNKIGLKASNLIDKVFNKI